MNSIYSLLGELGLDTISEMFGFFLTDLQTWPISVCEAELLMCYAVIFHERTPFFEPPLCCEAWSKFLSLLVLG